ncbi:MAG: ABC transporter ATP-binding protein, partial [Clostridia bacterium]
MPDIELKNITKIFKNNKKSVVTAIEDVSIKINDGEFCVIIGASGCGKTTLLRAIAGIEPINSGLILFNGVNVTDSLPADRHISFISQNCVLYPNMTIFDNIAFPLRAQHLPLEEVNSKVAEVANMLDITFLLSRKPNMISIGQQQKAALARAIAIKPNLFLFDEPFSNLDVQARLPLRNELKKAHERFQSTFIFVTHDST